MVSVVPVDTRRITFIVPVHNESEIIASMIDGISSFPGAATVTSTNIVIVENGSSDDSKQQVAELCAARGDKTHVGSLIGLSEDSAGIGYAYARGIQEALRRGMNTYQDWIVLTACDLPFADSDLAAFLIEQTVHPECSIFIGSKGHPASRARRGIIRFVMTKSFSWLRYLLLGMAVKDTQGTFFIRGDVCACLANETTSRDFLFTTELCFRAFQMKMQIIELPVTLQREVRPSSVRPVRDSLRMARGLLKLLTQKRNSGLQRSSGAF